MWIGMVFEMSNLLNIFAFKTYINLKPLRMKRKSLLIIILVLISATTFSQIRFGIKAGISSSSIKASDIVEGDYEYSTLSNAKVGFHGGLFSQITLWGVFIQPEMLLSSTGGEVQIKEITSGQTKISSQRFTKLDIPVIVGKKFGPVRLGLGPVASIILNKPSDALDFSGTSVKNKFNSATFGYQLDLGLNLGSFTFDLKYEGNLSKLGDGVVIGGQERKFDSRNRQWLFSVGMFF
jgi:hypothetical protein